jgi:hypothetical protein
VRRWSILAGAGWILAGEIALLATPPVAAQRIRIAYAATQSNNQHKLFGHGGRLYVTYTRPVGGTPQVHVDTSTDGRRWQALGQVSRGAGPSSLSTIVVDRSGTVHLAWTQFDGPIGRVYYSRYQRAWTPPLAVSSATAYAGYPSLDADGRGRLHLVWYGIRQPSSGQPTPHGGIYEIYYVQRDHGVWGRPEWISPGVPDAINPALAVDGRDGVHVVWFQSDGRAYQIMYATRSPAGAWTAPVPLTSGEKPSTKPALAVDAGGTIHIVWEQNGGISYLRGRPGQWGTVHRVSETGTDPTIGLWSRGVFVLWTDGRAVALRAFDGAWRPRRTVGPGEYPNVGPWRSGPDAVPRVVWTVGAAAQITDLSRLLR